MTNERETVYAQPAEFSNMEEGAPGIVKSDNVSVLDLILERGGLTTESITSKWKQERTGIEFPFRALNQEQYDAITKKNTTMSRLRRSNVVHTQLNQSSAGIDFIATACLDPNFMDPETRRKLASKGGRGAFDTVKDTVSLVFLPGEIADFTNAILGLSGFTGDDEETVAELKE